MGERNLRVGRSAKGRGDAGNDFKLDAGLAQGFHLFSSAAEDQRVATLEADHLQPQQRILNHQRVNFGLADALLPEALATF